QCHEHRHTLPSAERSQPLGQIPFDHKVLYGSSITRLCRSRTVCRQLQFFHSRQLLPPIPKLFLKHVSLEPLSLPNREIRILNWQLIERRWLSRTVRLIERSDFSDQDPHRPLIAHDMVHCVKHHVLLLFKFEHLHSQHWTFRQIESCYCLLCSYPADLCFSFFQRHTRQIFNLQSPRSPFVYHLHRYALLHFYPCPEYFMSPDDLIDYPLQCLKI